ncbi:hypothetical protein [Massilia sp. PWRC2]|uniref:hypothetical protein n=1 Tax=Massilia sp. PWRC2 TaxID=2804626 RepID=UPI003CF9F9C5
MKLRLAVFSVLLAICQSSFAQREFPFREIIFDGVSVSGFHQGEPFEYFLIKRKILAGLPIAQESAVIQEWSKQHPGATALPVSIIGEESQLPIVYVWAVDGNDILNVYLVRKGVHPAIGMLDTAKFGRLLQASSNAPFIKLAARGERAGNPTGVVSRRLIPKLSYDTFVNELIAAETLAQRESLGIWSDSFKKVREQIGLVPLSSLPLTSDEFDFD